MLNHLLVGAGAGQFAVRMGTFSVLFHRRTMGLCLVLTLLLIALGGLALMVGAIPISPTQLVAALTGQADHSTQLLVLEFRLPRVYLALCAGAALGAAGCLTQALTRNRLATPELLGISDGAVGAVLLALIVSPTGMLGPWWVGPSGAALAALVLLLVSGPIGTQGQRILIIGIGLSALLRAGIELALSQQDLLHANALHIWRNGSLATQGMDATAPLLIGLLLLLPPALLNTRRLSLLHFQPEHVHALGISLRTLQWQALFTALGLAGLAIGLCGPIAFVALASPILATQFTRGGHLPLLTSALLGSGLVLIADTLARTLFTHIELPAGIVCNLLGGPFLLGLLLHRKGNTQ